MYFIMHISGMVNKCEGFRKLFSYLYNKFNLYFEEVFTMSITEETAKAHANDPAVCCCRFEAGTVVEAANLEDPAIFPDLVDSGLLEIPENTLTIGQALGGTLKETLDALSPMTTENVDGYSEVVEEEEEKEEVTEEVSGEISSGSVTTQKVDGVIKIRIEEGTGIYLEIPAGV